MKEGLPKVRDKLSGLQACLREGDKVLTVQGSVANVTYLNINGQDMWVETDLLLEAINKVAEANKQKKGATPCRSTSA